MTTIIKEETKMDSQGKTYLQKYEEYIIGYKQYKKETFVRGTESVKVVPVDK